MDFVGYKYFDEARTRRSAEVLRMNPGEKLEKFRKRCEKLGFEMYDSRNLVDHYKNMSNELIRGDLDAHRHPNLYLMCVNIINDFNVASCIRASNAFGVREVLLFGEKRFDQRGDVGTRHYANFRHVKDLDSLDNVISEFDEVISLDNCDGSKDIASHTWDYDKKILIIAGQESIGVPGELLEMSTHILYIKQMGSVRSLNVAQAVSVALYDYNAKMNTV